MVLHVVYVVYVLLLTIADGWIVWVERQKSLNIGGCFCNSLLGPVPHALYIRVVDLSGERVIVN